MPSLASIYCPCWENSDSFEAIRETKMNVPLQMWHGGFSSKKCWRELDRFLVEHLCGISSAMEINHLWAKSADCHENPNHESNCKELFDSSLKKSANSSAVQIGCKQYYEMINAFLPFSQSMTFDYKITYVNTSELIYLQPYEYRNDRLYLMNNFEENAYFTCFAVKREVSSCNYMFEHCKNHEKSEKCGEKLIDCLSETSSECKKLLVQRNDNMSTLEKIYHFMKNNKLQLAWPIILYCFWTLTKSVINWILLSISIRICLKISELLDRCRDSIENKTNEIKNRNQLDPLPYRTSIIITGEFVNDEPMDPGFVDIPLEDDVIRGNNDNNANGIEEDSIDPEKDEKEEKKKEKDYNFGQSFRKMLISFGRFVRSIYRFFEVFFKNSD
uniref:DUF19 domain-containing protein n=1 Tax=Caenorhabditis tropicalis TaxID=1561998 RepID=A0A1I7T875_9PELO